MQSVEGLPTPAAHSAAQDDQNNLQLQSQVVLILVGLVGSGKSTFAQALQDHFPNVRRCSQDDLGNRIRVEELARTSLQNGISVCIDRTNIDIRQRATWVSIAREVPGTQVWVLVFDTPYKVCEERLQTRQGHPTITSPEVAISVLQQFWSQYQLPHAHEGYDRELRLRPSDQKQHYTAEDVKDILHRLQSSPQISPPLAQRWGAGFSTPHGQPSYRSYGNRNWSSSRSGRGRGRVNTHLGEHYPMSRTEGGKTQGSDAPWRRL